MRFEVRDDADGTVLLGSTTHSTVEADEEIALEGWTKCPAFTTRTTSIYQSPDFLALASQEKEYLDSLVPLLDGRAVSLENMYNVFDYMNVQYVHNETFRELVTENGSSDYIMVSPRLGLGDIVGRIARGSDLSHDAQSEKIPPSRQLPRTSPLYRPGHGWDREYRGADHHPAHHRCLEVDR